MITSPTAADAPDGYWSHPDLENLGQKWKWRGISSPQKHLGDALAGDDRFMDDYLGNEIQYICDNIKDPDIFEQWLSHCRYDINRAGYETDQEWVTAYTEYARLAPDDDVYKWAHERIMSDVSDYWSIVRDICKEPDTDLRIDHEITGVWSEAYNAVHPIETILGWCPTCVGPLVRADISWGRDVQGSGEEVEVFVCPECGAADPITGNEGKGFEAKWCRPFHLPIDPKQLGLKEE